MIKFIFISIILHLFCLGFFLESFSQAKKPINFNSTVIDLNSFINNKSSAKVSPKTSAQNKNVSKSSYVEPKNEDEIQGNSENGIQNSPNIVNSPNKDVTIIKSIEPEYPLIARKNGQEGEVKVDVQIDENGKIISKKIIQSSKYKLLDNSVLNSLDQFVFSPAKNNFKTVMSKITINYLFKLN